MSFFFSYGSVSLVNPETEKSFINTNDLVTSKRWPGNAPSNLDQYGKRKKPRTSYVEVKLVFQKTLPISGKIYEIMSLFEGGCGGGLTNGRRHGFSRLT